METSGYHFPGALERLGGDQKFLRELAIYFIEDAPEYLRAIHAGLAAGSAGRFNELPIVCEAWRRTSMRNKPWRCPGSIERWCEKGELQLVPTALARPRD